MEVIDEMAYRFDGECLKFSEEMRKKADDDPLLTITTVPNTFIFSVETTGALTPTEVVKSAFQKLSEKINTINYELGGDGQKSDETIQIRRDRTIIQSRMWCITFQNSFF